MAHGATRQGPSREFALARIATRLPRRRSICSSAAYGAFAGNMALATLAHGGVLHRGRHRAEDRARSSRTALHARVHGEGPLQKLLETMPGARRHERPGRALRRALPKRRRRCSDRRGDLRTALARRNSASSASRVDVAERVRLSSNGTSTTFRAAVPRVDLAAAAFEERGEARQHAPAAQAEHGVRLVAGLRDREIGAVRVRERACSRDDEIERQERRVARRGRDQTGCALRESPACSPASGPAKPPIASGMTRWPKRRVRLQVLVGVDEHLVDLRREALDHPLDHRPAAEGFRPLSTPPMRRPWPPARIDAGDCADRGCRRRLTRTSSG